MTEKLTDKALTLEISDEGSEVLVRFLTGPYRTRGQR